MSFAFDVIIIIIIIIILQIIVSYYIISFSILSQWHERNENEEVFRKNSLRCPAYPHSLDDIPHPHCSWR